MRRLLAAVLSLTVLAAVPVSSAEAAKPKKHRCTAKGATTLKKNRYARVFTAPGPGRHSDDRTITSRMYGCLYSLGRRVLLDVEWDDDEQSSSGSVERVILRGRFVAWENFRFDGQCKGGCTPDYIPQTWGVAVQDLRRTRFGGDSIETKSDVLDFVLSRLGSVAWLEHGGKVRAFEAGTLRELDPSGADPASLRLRGTTLSWRNGGALRTATLR